MTITDLLSRLDRVRARGLGRWSACCPSHADKSPSLSIREAEGKILLYCFSLCRTEQIVEAIGLELKDLFTNTSSHCGQRPTPKPQKLDLLAEAHRFELAALDRRLRADAILQAVAKTSNVQITEVQRDRLMNVVADAYVDRDRAEFLETVADSYRVKAFHERTQHHAT